MSRADLCRPAALLTADAAGLGLSLLLGYWLAEGIRLVMFGPTPDLLTPPEFPAGRLAEFGALGAGLLLWLNYRGHHNARLPAWTEAGQLVAGCLAVLLLDGFFQFAQKAAPSRLWLVQSWGLAVPMVLLCRRVARHGLDALGLWRVPTLIVAAGDGRGAAVAELLAANPSLGYHVVSVLGPGSVEGRLPWGRLCGEMGVRFVVVAASGADLVRHRTLLDSLMAEGIPFAVAPEMAGMPVAGIDWQYFPGQDAVLVLARENLFRPLSRLLKVLFDRVVGTLLFLAALPAFVLFAVIIRADGGTVFYAHRRVGLGGKPFDAYKFRTMTPDAERVLTRLLDEDGSARAEWETHHKLARDPRITRFGRFLRAFSLDELPQLINVLLGQMSLVGPRPVTEDEMARFGDEIRFYLSVRPGLTGLWQVSGRSATHYDERVRLNTWYVKNWSLALDILILLKTIPAVLGRRGAY